MFLNFINSLKVDITRQTAFLEACDWSEEDLAVLLQHTDEVIYEIKKSNMLINSFEQFESLFIEKMSAHTPERQIHIILKHLKNDLQSNVIDEETAGY